MPELTVVIPTKDRSDLLRRSVGSVLAEGGDIEVIVVDDASAPEHARVIDDICSHERVRLIRNPTSMFAPHARNQGLAAAHGRYWASLDDDDEWLPGKWKRQRAFLEAQGFPDDMVLLSGFRASLEGGRTEEYRPKVGDPERITSLRELFDRAPVHAFSYTFVAPTALVSGIGGWDEEMVWGEYTDLLIRFGAAARIAGLPSIDTVAYRWHERVDGRVGRDWTRKGQGIRRLLEKHADAFEASPDVLATYLHVLGVTELRMGHRARAARALMQAVRRAPSSGRRVRAVGHLVTAVVGGRSLWRGLSRVRGRPAEVVR